MNSTLTNGTVLAYLANKKLVTGSRHKCMCMAGGHMCAFDVYRFSFQIHN